MQLQAIFPRLSSLLKYRLGLGVILFIVVYRLHITHRQRYLLDLTTDPIENATLDSIKDCSQCDWFEPIYESKTGEYKLCFGYNGTASSTELGEPSRINEQRIRKTGRNKNLTFEDLMDIPDGDWRNDFDTEVYDLFPQDVPMWETLERVKKCLPLFKTPIFNPGLHYLHVPKKTCPPLSANQSQANPNSMLDLVVVYKSALYNFESRQELRRLYNVTNRGLNIHIVFSIGIPRTSKGIVFQRDGFNATLRGRAADKLTKHSSNMEATKIALEKELREHSDLLVGNFEDSYFNLTLKLYYTYQWAARFCRPYKPVFVFIDDDYAFNTEKLIEFIRSKRPEERANFSYGLTVALNPVHRSDFHWSQWAVSKKEIPWPVHVKELLGIYSMYGYPLVRDMALGMHFTQPIHIDDIWLAMVQWKLKIKASILDGMYLFAPTNARLECKGILFAPTNALTSRKCKL